jgi:hypothetical protein
MFGIITLIESSVFIRSSVCIACRTLAFTFYLLPFTFYLLSSFFTNALFYSLSTWFGRTLVIHAKMADLEPKPYSPSANTSESGSESSIQNTQKTL